MRDRMRRESRRSRAVLAGLLSASLLASFGLLGGVGFADAALNALQYQYGKQKVTICHKNKGKKKGVTIRVAQPALKAHLKHGDTLGACAASSGQAQKAKQKGQGKGEQAEQKDQTTATQPERGKSADKGKGQGNGQGKGRRK